MLEPIRDCLFRQAKRLCIPTAALILSVPIPAVAETDAPPVFGKFDGEPMYTVLPPDAIPAIRRPEFVTGSAATSQMVPNEPVIGVVIGDEAHAYSAWQLDAHEIVNDKIAGTEIAATW
ncbi:MAG: DUF3179 domain-containing protein [bacterium]|nr:DUF3179 domain-containing protein [bacterium]